MNASRLLMALVLLTGLGGAVWWSNKEEKAKEGKPAADAGPRILSIAADTVQEIDIQRKGGESTTVKKGSDGKWIITSPKQLAADASSVAGITAAVTALNAERLLDSNGTEWASYGLEPALVAVDFKTKDGKSTTLLMGEHTPSGSSIYARLAGDPRLFTMSAFTKPEIDKLAKDLRDKRLLTFIQEKLNRIEVRGAKGGVGFAKAGDAEWRIVTPKPMRAESAQMDDLITKLKGASIDTVASADVIREATEAYATAPLVANVRVTDAAGTQTLEVRKWKEDYYAKSSVVSDVNKIAKELGQVLEKPADEYRNKKLFDFGFSELSRVEVTDGAKTLAFEKKGDKWMAVGKESAGKAMDSTSVQAFIDRLRDLAAAKFVESGFTKPAVTLTVVSNEGKRTEKVELSEAAAGNFIARRKGEAALYELDAATVKDLRQAVGDVREAQPEKTQSEKNQPERKK